MTKLKISIILGAFLLMVTSCADEDLAPIVTFDQATTGAYPRLLDNTSTTVNLFDIDGSQFDYTVEFVDIEQGNQVAEYVLEMTFEDNNPDNGDDSAGPLEFRRFTQDDFTTNANGFREISVSISANDAIAAAGTSADALEPGDAFVFVGRLILTDGREFADVNSAPQITGSAFRGFFDFTMTASCPSDLTGSYEYTTTDIWCGAGEQTGTVDIVAEGSGVYQFSDWSFGTYDGVCYSGGTPPPAGMTFQDVCNEVSFTAFVSQYGDTFEFTSSIEGNEWTIQWQNDFGEAATSVIRFPNGADWPITLAE